MALDFGLLSGMFPTSSLTGMSVGTDSMTQVAWADVGVYVGEPVMNIHNVHPTAPYTAYGELATAEVGTEGQARTIILCWRLRATLKDTGDVSDTATYQLRIESDMGSYTAALGSNGSPGTTDIDVVGTMVDSNDVIAGGFNGKVIVYVEAKMSGDGTYGAGQMGISAVTFNIWVLT